MFYRQKIRLWNWRAETLQLLVDQQFMLTITEDLGDGKYMGMLEDGSVYTFENGSWRAESAKGEMRLDMAVQVWNTMRCNPEESMRVILLPGGSIIVPDGDVEKC